MSPFFKTVMRYLNMSAIFMLLLTVLFSCSNGEDYSDPKSGFSFIETLPEIDVSSVETNVKIKFTSESNWTASPKLEPATPTWATIDKLEGKGGAQTNIVTVSLEPNEDRENEKVVTITITHEGGSSTVKITQGKGLKTEVTPNGFNIKIGGGAPINNDAKNRLISDITNLSEILSPELIEQLQDATIFINNDGANKYVPKESSEPFAGNIVIGDIAAYKSDVEKNQPMLIMNLLARSYYDINLNATQKKDIEDTFNAVKATKYAKNYYSNGVKYEIVKNNPNAGRIAPDAGKDAISYFAELTEAYLGENDFYPIDYSELERFDPSGFAHVKAIWEEREITPNKHGITLPPTSLTQWLNYVESPLDEYYSKYLLTTCGLAVVASRFVNDEAIVQAAYIIDHMVSRIPDAVEAMLDDKFRIGIAGVNENITDLPEARLMNEWWPETDWDARGRGYGATESIPLMTCGEENIIAGMDDVYKSESIMVHEFAHDVDHGLRIARKNDWINNLESTYKAARNAGKWSGTCYAGSNVKEYFAVGAQAWFDTANAHDIPGYNGSLKTRAQLKEYDRGLYDILESILPNEGLVGYHFPAK